MIHSIFFVNYVWRNFIFISIFILSSFLSLTVNSWNPINQEKLTHMKLAVFKDVNNNTPVLQQSKFPFAGGLFRHILWTGNGGSCGCHNNALRQGGRGYLVLHVSCGYCGHCNESGKNFPCLWLALSTHNRKARGNLHNMGWVWKKNTQIYEAF